MGCHLYVKEIKTGNDVYIPWISVFQLLHIEITDKRELETFLKFHQLLDRNYKANIEYNIDYLNKFEDDGDAKTLKELGRSYKFSNIYQIEKEKGKTEVEALLVVYKTELERHIKFSLTDRVRDEILDTFKEGIHRAYTG